MTRRVGGGEYSSVVDIHRMTVNPNQGFLGRGTGWAGTGGMGTGQGEGGRGSQSNNSYK